MKQTTHLIILYAVLALIVGCTNSSDTKNDTKTQAAWEQYHDAYEAKDLERTLAVVDSMEQAQIVNMAMADYLRGHAYDACWQMRIAEHFYKKSYEGYAPDPSQDWYRYTDAGYRWAALLFRRGDTKGALSVTTKLLSQAEENDSFPNDVKGSLLMLMSEVQMQLRQFDEARLTWQKAYETLEKNSEKARHKGWGMAWVSFEISTKLHKTGNIEEALEWIDRSEQWLAVAEQEHDDSLLIEEWKGHVALTRALYLQESGHPVEAAATYAAVPRSRLCEPNGYTEAASYLMAAGRYDEAAYWYEQIDSTYIATDGAQMTLDIITERLSPRYVAYRKARRDADALVIADSISESIDSALAWQKKNDAAELSVIYQTHERDLRIKDLRFTVYFHRIIAIALVIILLLIAYLLWRSYRYNKVLRAKNRHLYKQIEEHAKEEEKMLSTLQAQPEESLSTEQQLFRRICILMAEQQPYIDENLNRDTLAQLLGTNARYVVQAVRNCSHGETVSDFITRYRLEHVARLLKTTDDPVNLIGELSGIPSRATLARLFRHYYGMTCSEFRQAAQAKA